MEASSLRASFRRPIRDGVERQQWMDILHVIDSVTLSSSSDRWSCDLNGEGTFRVKDIRLVLDDIYLPALSVETRWVRYVPIKVNVFAWRARLDRLPTRLNLSKRGILTNSIACPICDSAQEDVHHLFFGCAMAKDFSSLICRWWNLPWIAMVSFSDWDAWFLSTRLSSKLKSLLEGVFLTAWWSIWSFRNRLLFDDVPPRRSRIFDDIVSCSFNCAFNSESNPLERKDAEGPSLDESLENEEHLDVDSCDSDSPKNVNNDSVSPSSRVLREEDVRGVESDLVDSFEEGEIHDDSVLYNDGCIKDCMEKNLEDDAGEILGVHSQGDCGNVTTDDNEDVTSVIAPEKDSIIAPLSTPLGNDLNIAAESGSSWIDYIGPLTSDEIDSDKRWSYRDPNGNIHGLFSLAQLRSWKDYFPSDLQIWSYYGNVKEAILLHNALSRQTKDAG
ncbi:RNA-directed DNA polymerase, eukaryota [Tanacetum coccineum]